uniref:Uncharacterized protein n=1 Tax=Cyclophora tenuis TaxID=216820 RepID=A0A7S1GHD4_CYCTE|mmetsp:Transcript_14517/g.24656  ORF Transcript_14517/g.24656 Transcript_14517/m.24656 type:complete len:129 (+) Transcript_14517:65-451(+)
MSGQMPRLQAKGTSSCMGRCSGTFSLGLLSKVVLVCFTTCSALSRLSVTPISTMGLPCGISKQPSIPTIIDKGKVISVNLAKWHNKYKVEASPGKPLGKGCLDPTTFKKLFTPDTKKAVKEQQNIRQG